MSHGAGAAARKVRGFGAGMVGVRGLSFPGPLNRWEMHGSKPRTPRDARLEAHPRRTLPSTRLRATGGFPKSPAAPPL